MRLTQWLWTDRSPPARLARLALAPTSLAFRAVAAARATLYGAGVLPSRILPAPSVAVGNLTVGGSGKTPIAGWIASYYLEQGLAPAVLLRGYGRDEGDMLRAQVSGALVVENPDRLAGAREAVARGADVLVLDDAFQRLDVRRDLNIVLVSAESAGAVRWTLPAGPWREGWGALERADMAVITRKAASRDVAERTADLVQRRMRGTPVALAHLGLGPFRGLVSGAELSAEALHRTNVVVAAGVADPTALGRQVGALGAHVELLPLTDHYQYEAADISRLLQVAREVDYVVVTAKDAVKLARRWPDPTREPLVATLTVEWEEGAGAVREALDAVTRHEAADPNYGRR